LISGQGRTGWRRIDGLYTLFLIFLQTSVTLITSIRINQS
jgi:hypothetical protein